MADALQWVERPIVATAGARIDLDPKYGLANRV